MTNTVPESSKPKRPWRDVRDGPPPPQYYELARRVTQKAYDRMIPPLNATDVVILAGLALAAKFLYPAVKRDGAPNMLAYAVLDIQGILDVLIADPVWADRAGILWAPSPKDRESAVIAAASAWMDSSLTPALGGPWCSNPDLSERGKLLKFNWQQIDRGFFQPDFGQMAQGLAGVVVDNVGGNEMKVGQRERVPPKELLGWYKFLADLGPSPTDIFDFTTGKLTLNTSAAGELLESKIGAGTSLDGKVKSLDYENEGGHGLADSLQAEGAVHPEDELALRELRDLRDLHDLSASHPLLDRLAEHAELDADHARELCDLLARLLPLLNGIEDAALRAATVYELGARGPSGHGGWSRAEVGRSYGVTQRQIEKRKTQAAQLVAGLFAA